MVENGTSKMADTKTIDAPQASCAAKIPLSECIQPVTVLDAPLKPLVTPDVLNKARAKTDLKVVDYNTFSVDFEGSTPYDPLDAAFLQHPHKICDSALDLVGRTPAVRLSRLAKKYGLKCELVAKCDFLSIGGSVKDRIGKQMMEEAERSGRIKPGDTIVEATSGNTGVGLCLAAALKGYRCVITLPEKMSTEKLNTMAALGAEIVRTPTGAAWNSLDGHLGLAVQLQKTLPNCHFLDQYSNPANPRVHYLGTAEEILYQCDNKIDVLVMTVGTGGTVTGVAKKIKEKIPTCKIVGVDPKGSLLAEPEMLNDERRGQSYLVEGIGYDFIPSSLHRGVVDEWVKTDDDEGLRMARELIRLEGLLVGGSSGSAIAGALKVARYLGPNDRCVVLLPDSARNYMTKFISDEWMVDNEFYPPPAQPSVYGDRKISDLLQQQPNSPVTVVKGSSIRATINTMVERGSQIVVVTDGGEPVGVATHNSLTSALVSGRFTMEDSIDRIMTIKFRRAKSDTALVDVARMFGIHPCVVITDDKNKLVGVVTPLDLLKSITN